ncbi:UNVERIFIED_CONTAM: hypothetical protein K2H54_008632 [Gekko kuhli]
MEGDLGEDMWVNPLKPYRSWHPFEKPKLDNNPARQTSPNLKIKETVTCFSCGEKGHIRKFCKQKEPESKFPPKTVKLLKNVQPDLEESEPQTSGSESESEQANRIMRVWKVEEGLDKEYMEPLTVNNQKIEAYRDTGAQVTLIQPQLVQNHQILTGEKYTLKGILGPAVEVPVAEIPVQYKNYQGTWTVGVLPDIGVQMLLGNDLASEVNKAEANPVRMATRSMTGPVTIETEEQPDVTMLHVAPAEELRREQRQDDSIKERGQVEKKAHQQADVYQQFLKDFECVPAEPSRQTNVFQQFLRDFANVPVEPSQPTDVYKEVSTRHQSEKKLQGQSEKKLQGQSEKKLQGQSEKKLQGQSEKKLQGQSEKKLQGQSEKKLQETGR